MRLLRTVVAVLPLFVGCHDDRDDSTNVTREIRADAVNGSDSGGDGSPGNPYRTITHALTRADGNDIVFVAPGTYSAFIGEQFPIVVPGGVRIEGEPGTKGMGSPPTLVLGGGPVTISGGVLSGQVVNAAMALSSGSLVRGLAITNPGGSGAVVENASATVEFCTVTQNTGDGLLFVNGATGSCNHNTISSNTGEGVRVRDNSAPQLFQNSIVDNVGSGVRADETSNPDLAGGNTLEGNGGVGLFNNTTASTISAVNNKWIAGVQGSSAGGTYPSAVQPGPVGFAGGNNFAIANGAASIQF